MTHRTARKVLGAAFAVALAVVVAQVSGCAPLQCQTADVGIWPHPSKPAPAGRVIVKCDDKPKVILDADKVGAP